MSHFVYLYRDSKRRPQYVGYGNLADRANDHLRESHNAKLNELVASGKFSIEIAGPFESEVIGRTIEACLISALCPDCNVAKGPSVARFRPLGVPVDYAERLSMPLLQKEDFLRLQGEIPSSVLFVKVGDTDFGDDRTPYDLANPPSDDKLLERVDRWWQLARYLPAWRAKPEASPSLLVGVNGSPGSQIVIASAKIDRTTWDKVETYPGGKIIVPINHSPNLDALNLRGRRIDRNAGIAFGPFYARHYNLLMTDGMFLR